MNDECLLNFTHLPEYTNKHQPNFAVPLIILAGSIVAFLLYKKALLENTDKSKL
jgi:hypothetical protein